MMRGSREELVQFNIDGKIDLPGVGRSLTDYLVSSTVEYMLYIASDLNADHFYVLRDRKGRPDKLLASYHKSNRAKAYMQ